MKTVFLIASILCLTGCVSVLEETKSAGSFPRELKAVSQIRMVGAGMSKKEVRSVLDEQITIGYEKGREGIPYAPLTLNNPYRFQTVNQDGRVFEVYYYFTGIKQSDGQITDDELIPIVFENDKVIGKNWNFLKELTQSPG